MSFGSLLLLAVMLGGAVPRENTGFTPGHIFVSVLEVEACLNGREWIVEIDPATGDWSVFADSDDGLCQVNGLRFTPDGSLLLAAEYGNTAIRAFAPDGSSENMLTYLDGIAGPVGANCLAFDAAADLYVLNAATSMILRFPNAQPPGSVFADYLDGIYDRGALDFSPSGDLFYTGDLAEAIIRISPAGQASVFDDNQGFTSLASDDQGNLFAASGARVVRYDGPGPDPTSRRVLAEGFGGAPQVALALSPDHRSLYFADNDARVHVIDPDTGASTLLADLSELPSVLAVFPSGATVYAPDPDLIPGRCCFGLGTLADGCIDGVTRPECADRSPPFVFTPKESCPPKGPACEVVLGACCDSDAFGGCTEGTLISQCQCVTCARYESLACADTGCAVNTIPTASAWGLAALTLLLMIAAKVMFGRRARTSLVTYEG